VSTLLFPTTLPGIDIKVKKTPTFSTIIQPGSSGKEMRATFQSTPRWSYELTLNFLRKLNFSLNTSIDEYVALATLFNAVLGSWDTFYFIDPENGSPSNITFANGTGSQTAFQLIDDEGFTATLIQGTPSIYVNGTLQTAGTAYTLNAATGVVTFTSAPANGAMLTWTGQFARVVRFVDDTLDFERFLNLAWKGGTIKLISVK